MRVLRNIKKQGLPAGRGIRYVVHREYLRLMHRRNVSVYEREAVNHIDDPLLAVLLCDPLENKS